MRRWWETEMGGWLLPGCGATIRLARALLLGLLEWRRGATRGGPCNVIPVALAAADPAFWLSERWTPGFSLDGLSSRRSGD